MQFDLSTRNNPYFSPELEGGGDGVHKWKSEEERGWGFSIFFMIFV